jgi:long-chain acyl-CoA synthetase
MGVEDGDRVALVAENRPAWLIADLAIMAAGGITVPAYTTNTPADHAHVLSDSGACGVIVSTAALLARVAPALERAPACRFLVPIDAAGEGAALAGPDLAVAPWTALTGREPTAEERAELDARVAALARTDVACLIYTSGTSGLPRGVMQTHGGILANCRDARRLLDRLGVIAPAEGGEVFLSFLPLSHAYEHTGGQCLPLTLGATIHYANGLDRLAKDIAEVRPTVMTVVPRLFEVLERRMARDVARKGALAQAAWRRTLALGARRHRAGGRLPPPLALLDRLVGGPVRRQVGARFGGRLKALVSGGAPLDERVAETFVALGLPVYQGYGQTEASPVIACNRPGDVRLDTVGPPLDGVEVRIAEDGEILVRGETVMAGYWHRPDETAAAIVDGWLHTGDIGRLEPDGHLKITDRKKDILVSSGGDNIAPQRVEGVLVAEPEIAQAMVVGDGRPFVAALVVADADWQAAWARDAARPDDIAVLADDPAFRQAMSAAIDRANTRLARPEAVRRFLIAPEALTIEAGLLTPTLKVRRHAVLARYGDRLDALYGDGAGGGG